jgi:hypothetical protein
MVLKPYASQRTKLCSRALHHTGGVAEKCLSPRSESRCTVAKDMYRTRVEDGQKLIKQLTLYIRREEEITVAVKVL